MADPQRETNPPVTRAQFIGRGAVLLTGVLGGALAATGCDRGAEQGPGDSMAALREVDPKLVRYKEVGQLEVEMREPRGLACDAEGRVWVVGDAGAICLTATGEVVRRIQLPQEPRCVAVGPDGRTWIGLMDRVLWLEPDGPVSGPGPEVAPAAYLTALAATERDVWAADWRSLAIHRLDRAGAPVGSICRKEPDRQYSGIVAPSPHVDVAVSARGNVFVSNPGMHRIEEHKPGGNLVRSWGTASSDLDGFCGCCNPTDFALLPDGRFVTAEKGIPRVKRYSPDGVFECVVAPPSDFASSAMGIDLATGPDGRIMVLDVKAARVRVYLPGERTV